MKLRSLFGRVRALSLSVTVRLSRGIVSWLRALNWSQLNAASGLVGIALVGVGLGVWLGAGPGLAAAGGCLVVDSVFTKWLMLGRRR